MIKKMKDEKIEVVRENDDLKERIQQLMSEHEKLGLEFKRHREEVGNQD